ncbi:MAG: phosphohydrolase [Gammaproteobacteria bacterium]|nr:phosphohydrolase [Gammaproteobacteria bacterium]
MDISTVDFSNLLEELTDIGIALSAQKDHRILLEMILLKAKELTNADGGTLYLRTNDDHLKFEIMITESLGIHKGGTSGEEIKFKPIALYDEFGQANNHMVATWAVLSGETVNIEDAYTDAKFDFSGTRAFDQQTGYRSRSFLTVPLTNHENSNIGVLQLLNAKDRETGAVKPFSELDQQVVESLASQAAVTITNQSLIVAQKKLFDAMIQLIANAIDEKSPYTAGHCHRVPILTNMIADAACRVSYGPLKTFSMSEPERYALNVAGWLHDCGKITTPEFVVDKSTKLETIYDRIELVETRFEILKRDREIQLLRKKLAELGSDPDPKTDSLFQSELIRLTDEYDFIRRSNIGGESMSETDKVNIRTIASRTWQGPDGTQQKLLTDEEIYNLVVERGTLTAEERKVINNHIVVTINMLESLPYPKHLESVPEYAGGHHEKMDGTGYPRGLTRDQMSIPARMMGIADIFEALTAGDRPYKKAMPLSQALSILGRMKLGNHIDPDLFDLFISEKVYLEYAEKYLSAEQIDEFDITAIPGYFPIPFSTN